MPELPEVETVCRGLAAVLEGHRLESVTLRRANLRQPFPDGFVAAVQGRRVERIWRRAKYYQWLLDDGQVILGHLGMSGTFEVSPPGSNLAPPGKHDHVVILTDHGAMVTYRDPRRFGLMTLTTLDELPRHPLVRDLGPEPLGEDFDALVLQRALAGRRSPVKPVLMDASVVVGVGNIYASESLFRAGIDPRRPALSLSFADCQTLVDAIRTVLAEALASGGSSLRDHRLVNGELGYFQHHFAVYDRAGNPCPGCICDLAETGGVQRIVQTGRSTFYCGQRQR
ncbi:bifunctional DNA-formamidopyrimidine glycosylase/DNA-(apurinic or apyrimidinic site) lyase [Insolitispirillum peregrinum]|uniref:Formamidopyrimidine-DNA glycosylase n=1 Tax=Insolitispirillum peregrinum TaxID=80876 RepID=A0A1N7MT69_9PROT|nr:bifunctional DNA-formamidopyrimidine glycosylase/DNA-(apurinic or apyrimidinic site) lyase [Insolitispirillum peregrinum]SIS89250.1 DNA-(apurinic or apyrimidinic site) lyase [Insolitispirillum peregrinum]